MRNICYILEETNFTRNLKIYGPKINISRKASEGLARRTWTRWICDISASLGKRRGRNLSSEKTLPESIWYSEGWFFWVFPRAQSAFFLITLNFFQGVLKVNSLQWSWCNLCRDSWQVPASSQQGPFIATYLTTFGGNFMAIVSHGVGKAHSQVSGRSHWEATQCAFIGPGLESSKSLWTIPVLLSLLVQANIPSCCLFPYLELHYYNHWSHMELHISILSQAQTHI